MAAKKSSNGTGRTRNYATVVYSESAPENWKDILTGLFIPAFISPLHDKDINPGGEPKKPHYHVIIMFDSVKTLEQAKAVFEQIGGVGCEVIASIRGYARYLCHLDNPEKAQYKPDDVICLCGSDFSSVCSLPTDNLKAIEEMQDWVDENHVLSYVTLMRYARTERRDWFRSLCTNSTIVMKEYMKTLQWEQREMERKIREGF